MRSFSPENLETLSNEHGLQRVVQRVGDRVGKRAVRVGVELLEGLRSRAEGGVAADVNVQIEDEAR